MTPDQPAAPLPLGNRMNRGQQNSRSRCRYVFLRPFVSRKPSGETVSTRLHLQAEPGAVWDRITFYEEIPERPPFLLRFLLPCPVRSEGGKTCVGATVRCTYEGGSLLKKITAVEPPHGIRFEVVDQRLGIEDCVRALSGSYQIRREREGSEVVLTTNYRSYLHPRLLWRPLEKFLVGRLHRHILGGMSVAQARSVAARTASTGHAIAESTPAGAIACTISQFPSPR